MTSVNLNHNLDVFGIGNALVDTLVFVEDDFLAKSGLDKGVMTLADGAAQAKLLLALQDHELELRSGGSAANSMWTVARCGGKAAYTGVVSNDPNGEFYKSDLSSNGVEFEIAPVPETNGPTGTCVVLTTPDAERTMSTHLGVSTNMEAPMIDVDRLKQSKFVYFEGYLWDGEKPKEACLHAMQIARENDVRVSFSFSDPFCVNRYREEFHMLTKDKCDLIFCNAEEARIFADKKDLDKAARDIGSMVELAFITNSEEGSLVVSGGQVEHVHGFPVHAVDTNGAGDAFAGGVLFAMSQGYDLRSAARWGNYLASQIVSIHGARLQNDYHEHLAEIIGTPVS